ncbi:MAG: hypothetical protein Ct9H90mP7_5040 [Candidatus Neomarinimicrobiota bacterium]|nr:MAG: hypothetical protein Ct9H90mP7_5040 [Candidatus Neomarinimicrobiota bacterium]
MRKKALILAIIRCSKKRGMEAHKTPVQLAFFPDFKGGIIQPFLFPVSQQGIFILSWVMKFSQMD